MKLKKGDHVIIITGKDKGKKGKIVKALPKIERVIVDGLNLVTRHRKPRKSGEKGQTIKMAMPIHVSNVMILDPKNDKGSRIAKKIVNDKKVRISKKSNQEI